jgi:cytoskeletal protein CcmA (bactofilin family)
MFGRKKDDGDDGNPPGEARAEATAPLPLRSRAPQAATNLTPPARAPVSRPEAPRRMPEMPGGISRRPDQPGSDDAKKLIVGREIFLNGEINSCDRLIVEGRVEASMKDCREIEIAETGTFKGQAEIDRADISGVFEGDLTAREHLVVRATGRIMGKVRFGELEIERGGQIVGDVQVFGESAAPSRDSSFPADTTTE